MDITMTDIKPDVEIPDLSTFPDASPSDPLEALSWLGETVEEVAEGLRARGIKGKRGSSTSCPLYNYLRLYGFRRQIDYRTIDGVLVLGQERLLSLPQLVRFAREFDDGKYPDLANG